MKTEFFSVLDHVYQILRVYYVSYEDISALMGSIFPRGKGTTPRAFNDSMDGADFPVLENFNIIHYGEQCPERGRTQIIPPPTSGQCFQFAHCRRTLQ